MPWDPARDLLTMQERLESLFGRAAPGWVPPVDLVERPDRYVLTVELPGLRREDVHIDGGEDSRRRQRPAAEPAVLSGPLSPTRTRPGIFSRSFRFGQPIQVDQISAELADGVLTITVPKAQPAIGRIEVR